MKDSINTDGKWEILSSEHLFRRPWLTVRKDCVKLPNGQVNDEFYVLEYPDWVNVIAITKDGDYVMERQYRHGLGVTCYEICAGVVEEGEPPLEAAKRELLEETGYAGGQWEEIMTVCGNSSTTNNYTHCFVARGVEKAMDCIRVGYEVVGLDVHHVHVHLLPLSGPKDMDLSRAHLDLTGEQMKEIAQTIASHIEK